MKKWVLWCMAICIAVSSLTGCTSQHREETAQDAQKTFVFGDTTFNPENNEPDINPHNDNSGWACIRYGVGETLFRYSDTMDIEPWLAQRITRDDDLTWHIVLHDGITFSSGRPVDGNAVKDCLEALVAHHKRAAGDLHIAYIEAQGQDVIIHTTVPVPTLPHYLSDPYGCIIDMQDGISPQGIVTGTGPYMATSLESGKELRLVKNRTYWNGTPKLDTIIVKTISDGDTLTMALQAGEIDGAYGMPYASYSLFPTDSYTISSAATSRAFFAWMNFDSPIMQDRAVRKAIALGIDKDGFVNTLLGGNGYPAVGAFPATMAFGGNTVHTEGYAPEEAKNILDEAGWIDSDGDGIREKNGKKLVIRWLTYPSRQELPLLAESAQDTLKKIGMDVEINCTADHNTLRANRGAWDVYASAMVTAPTGDPEYFFTYCTLERSDANVGRYHSDRLEALAIDLSRTFDTTQRGSLAVQMTQTLLDDNAYVFCSHLKMSMIAKKNVRGLLAHPCDFYEITVDLDKT